MELGACARRRRPRCKLHGGDGVLASIELGSILQSSGEGDASHLLPYKATTVW